MIRMFKKKLPQLISDKSRILCDISQPLGFDFVKSELA